MHEGIFIPWQLDAKRQPWVALFGNMTGQPLSRIRTADNAIHSVATDMGAIYGWSVWCSQCEVPINEEERTPHDRAKLLQASETAARSCDAGIFRIVQQGSAMLGDLYEIALDAAHAPPILVLLADDEPISKPFLALESQHPQVTIRYWNDIAQIYMTVNTWLSERCSAIRSGPARRDEIEQDYAPIGRALEIAWKSANLQTRRAVMSALMRTPAATQSLFESPSQLAAYGNHRLRLACAVLDVNPEAIRVMAAAQRCLAEDERRAWYVWSRNKSPDFSLGVLKSAVLKRPAGMINRTGSRLIHSGAWDQESRAYESGGKLH